MFAALLAFCFLTAPASAGVSISSAALEVSISAKKGNAVFHTVENLLLPPDAQPAARLRAVLTIANEGARVESGAVIRFALSARLRRIGTDGEGVWELPFLLEQRHVPQIKRGRGLNIFLPINRVAVVTYLKRLRAAGYWPDSLRVEAVIEPRVGTEDLAGRAAAKTIVVDWRPR